VQVRLRSAAAIRWSAFLESCPCAAGESGGAVKLLQCTLRDLGYFTGSATGVYGSVTRQAVANYQTAVGLSVTGDADMATCEALYTELLHSGNAGQVLTLGSDGERVTQLQSLLAECGYFDHNITGYFGATTDTAVRLFQMGNALPATGLVTDGTIALLQSNYARPLSGVSEALNAQVKALDGAARAVIGVAALRMRGQPFAADDEDLYPGFAFVQYACVSCGIPVVDPDDILPLMDEPVEDAEALVSGDIVRYRLRGDDSEYFAISSGGASILYARDGWVLETNLSALQPVELYQWRIVE
ncbi:MAG: peptidoglycan-binding protein, partial [Clostridia bacterium]|nr:peptidoglycan-binding protein [Clostridia bacterium]